MAVPVNALSGSVKWNAIEPAGGFDKSRIGTNEKDRLARPLVDLIEKQTRECALYSPLPGSISYAFGTVAGYAVSRQPTLKHGCLLSTIPGPV